MASSDGIKFVANAVLLNGFLYGLSTYIYDVFTDLIQINITNSVVAPITNDIFDMIKPFVMIGPLFNLIFLAVMAVLVANARSERLSPYFGINGYGVITYWSAVCITIVLTYVMSILDMITIKFATIFAVTPGGDWDFSNLIGTAFAIEHWVIIAIVVLAAVYVIVNSVSIETQQQVV
jgi:hypothetical protein